MDEWGVAQVLFYCLQGQFAFADDDEAVEKEVEFQVDVSEESKDFLKKLLMKNVEERLTYEKCLDHPWLLNRCVTYNTKENTVVSIDDNKQVISSSGFFNSKYNIISELCETDNSVVFIGSKRNGTQVVIKRSYFDDQDDLADNLKYGMPEEVLMQKLAGRVSVEGGKGNILKVLDWYIYDTYVVIITEYDKNFETLYYFTKKSTR